MRISDWSSDVCSSDLILEHDLGKPGDARVATAIGDAEVGQPRFHRIGIAAIEDDMIHPYARADRGEILLLGGHVDVGDRPPGESTEARRGGEVGGRTCTYRWCLYCSKPTHYINY